MLDWITIKYSKLDWIILKHMIEFHNHKLDQIILDWTELNWIRQTWTRIDFVV